MKFSILFAALLSLSISAKAQEADKDIYKQILAAGSASKLDCSKVTPPSENQTQAYSTLPLSELDIRLKNIEFNGWKIEGTSAFTVSFGADGLVQNASLIASSRNRDLDRLASSWVRCSRAKPGTPFTATIELNYSNIHR